MSARYISGLHASNFNIDNLAAEQGNNPADRPHEFKIIAGPAHIFREVHRMENTQQAFGHDRGRLYAVTAFADIDILRAPELLEGELLRVGALAAGKAERSLAPLPVLVQSDFARRAFHLFVNVLLLVRHFFNEYGKTAR